MNASQEGYGSLRKNKLNKNRPTSSSAKKDSNKFQSGY